MVEANLELVRSEAGYALETCFCLLLHRFLAAHITHTNNTMQLHRLIRRFQSATLSLSHHASVSPRQAKPRKSSHWSTGARKGRSRKKYGIMIDLFRVCIEWKLAQPRIPRQLFVVAGMGYVLQCEYQFTTSSKPPQRIKGLSAAHPIGPCVAWKADPIERTSQSRTIHASGEPSQSFAKPTTNIRACCSPTLRPRALASLASLMR